MLSHAAERAYAQKMLVFTAADSSSAVRAALACGAGRFVSRHSTLDTLVAAVNAILNGQRYVDFLVSHMLFPSATDLTTREREVLALMCDGLQNKVIAIQLGIGHDTVKAHVSRILNKLGATSRTEAVATAFRQSIID